MNSVLEDMTTESPRLLPPITAVTTSDWHGRKASEHELQESVLLQRARSGDELAFEIIVRRHGGRMLAAAQRLLQNSQDAEDAIQEAFLCAFRSLHQFEGQSRLGTWLHRIAINSALMRLRTRKRRRECSIENLLPTFHEDGHRQEILAAPQALVHTPLEAQELRAMVRAKIDCLPETYRTVLVLRDIEELTTEETAAVLKIQTGAVKTRLHRARLALRELLEPELA